ncbi:MAG: beta-ketoacyl-[acyl-carrier-protein] synthase family protein [Hyphomicrobiales bacterium]
MGTSSDRIVVTGLGLVTPFGVGRDAFWDGIQAARSTARGIESFDVTGLPTPFACPVRDDGFDAMAFVRNRKSVKLMGRATRFAVAAATLALADAALEVGDRDPGRFAVVHGSGGVGLHDLPHTRSLAALVNDLGTHGSEGDLVEFATRRLNPLTPLMMLPNITAAHIAIEHGFRGENQTICTACTSGTQAIGEALRLLRDGRADVVLAGGSDAMINPMGLVGFGMLGVLSRRAADPARAARPFDRDRDGFVMGEGSAMLVLELEHQARRRGVRPLAEIAGYGGCSDAYRITDEREDGSGCADAIRRALEDARIDSGDVDYVNAHGTGTRMNDRTEVRVLKEVFGTHARSLAVSSTKSQIGHLIAAAGAVEAAACILALRYGVVPPTINYETPDPECDLDFVPNAPREARLRTVVSNSFGFGGQNACLVFRNTP